jgi:hypothetical protein
MNNVYANEMDNFHNLSTDPTISLPRDALHQITRVLHGSLPSSLTDDAADDVRRDRAAIASVASLKPDNAAEARVAAQFVMADAWAADCFRLAREPGLEPESARRCRAQGMSLLRESKSSLRALHRLQAERRIEEADEKKAGRAAWAEHSVATILTEALPAAPVSPAPIREAMEPPGTENATPSRDVRSETELRLDTGLAAHPPELDPVGDPGHRGSGEHHRDQRQREPKGQGGDT